MVGCTTHKVSKEMWVDEFLHVNGPPGCCGCYPIPEHNQCSSYGTEYGALVAASTHPPKYVLVFVFLCIFDGSSYWVLKLGY